MSVKSSIPHSFIPQWRSLLFVPGDKPAVLEKAHQRGADAVIVDLEDAVAPQAKAGAREAFKSVAAQLKEKNVNIVVRINAPWLLATQDLAAVALPEVRAIMVPKVDDAARVIVVAEMLSELEAERGLPIGSIGIIALIESPAGISNLDEIAAAPRVIGLALGSEDFSLAFGVSPTPAILDLPCKLMALAASKANVMAIGMPLSITEFRDIEKLKEASLAGKSFGMTGALCIHPAQVEVHNECFKPSEQELEQARRVVEAWDNAGGAGVISLDGKMIDIPVVLRARRLISGA